MHKFEGKIIINEKIEASHRIKDYNHSKSVYEVIRVVESIPLFLTDHLKRLYASCYKKRMQIDKKDNYFIKKIKNVIAINPYHNKNIKIQVTEMNGKIIKIIGFIKSRYIEESYRVKGVHTVLHKGHRLDPNIKQRDDLFRKRIAYSLNEFQATEALLINQDNQITEGSRSNVFFVREDTIYTAPGKMVLKGITREKVFGICIQQNIHLIERPVHIENLNHYDGVFLTGTSIDILPVASINQYLYPPMNPIVKSIQNEYNRCKRMYLNTN